MEQDTVITVKSNTCFIKKIKIEYTDREVRHMRHLSVTLQKHSFKNVKKIS